MNFDTTPSKKIVLAEDDADDRSFFEDALNELKIAAELVVAEDGALLMDTLEVIVPPKPMVIFLDLNLPFKNGIACLKEIRQSTKLKEIPVVIFSTSDHPETITLTYRLGANLYIRKPNSFELLKKALEISLTADLERPVPEENYFLIIA